MDFKLVILNTDFICNFRDNKYIFLKEVTENFSMFIPKKSRATHPCQEHIYLKEVIKKYQKTNIPKKSGNPPLSIINIQINKLKSPGKLLLIVIIIHIQSK